MKMDGSLPRGYLLMPVLANMIERLTALERGRGINPAPPRQFHIGVGSKKRTVTLEEQAHMVAMYRKNFSAARIGRTLGFTCQTVLNQLRKCGALDGSAVAARRTVYLCLAMAVLLSACGRNVPVPVPVPRTVIVDALPVTGLMVAVEAVLDGRRILPPIEITPDGHNTFRVTIAGSLGVHRLALTSIDDAGARVVEPQRTVVIR